MANRFIEIAKLVESPDNIRRDMGDALELVREHFNTKYLKRIQKTIEAERLKTLSNPPREVALIAALKEFAPHDSHESYDRMAELIITLSSWKEIRANIERSGMQTARAASLGPVYPQDLEVNSDTNELDESVHPDGVYDIDPECAIGKRYNGGRLAEMMFMLSILGAAKK